MPFFKAVLLSHSKRYNNRAKVYSLKGEKKLALADFNEALNINPNDVASLSNRAYLLYSIGEYRAGVSDCDRLIKLQPNYSLAYCVRGLCRQKLEQYRSALFDLKTATKYSPDDMQLKQSILLLEGMIEEQKMNNSKDNNDAGTMQNIFRI